MFVSVLQILGVAISGILGVFVGLFAIAMANLITVTSDVPYWLIACGIVLLCAALFYLFGLVNRGFDAGIDRLTRGWFSTGVKATTASDAKDRRYRKAGRVAFFGGALAAFALSLIMTPAEMLEWFP